MFDFGGGDRQLDAGLESIRPIDAFPRGSPSPSPISPTAAAVKPKAPERRRRAISRAPAPSTTAATVKINGVRGIAPTKSRSGVQMQRKKNEMTKR